MADDGAGGHGTLASADPAAARRAAVPALRRGLQVLRFLASRPIPVPASAVARELGIARSSAYELLTELQAAGFVTHLAGERAWGLGVGAFEIGSAYLRGQPLERLGTPVVRALAAEATRAARESRRPGAPGDGSPVGATAHLGVLHGNEILYLAQERTERVGPALVTEVGVRLPAILTATGLSLLAGLPDPQVRALLPDAAAFVDRTGSGPRDLPSLRRELAVTAERGWAVEHGRVSPGTASVAAAARDHDGRPLAALGVTVRHRCATTDCDGVDALRPLVAPTVQAARRLTAAVHGRPAR